MKTFNESVISYRLSVISKILLLLFTFSFSLLTVKADIHYVSLDGGNISPYTNWSSAAMIPQDAIDTAMDGDKVIISNGVYSSGGVPAPGLDLTNRLMIAKSIMVESLNGKDVTIIAGQGPSDARAVRGAYLTDGAVLTGITLSNGVVNEIWGVPSLNRHGGGALMHYGGVISNCAVNNCTLIGGSANGGGIYLYKGGEIYNSTISENSAYNGGGIYCHSTGMIYNSVIKNNKAKVSGGVELFYGGIMQNCTIRDNAAVYSFPIAGGIRIVIDGTVRNCLITGNMVSNDSGGGVYFSGGGSVENSTISGNFADSGGGVFFFSGGTVTNSIVYSNSANSNTNYNDASKFAYSCSPGLSGSGNITNDPQFVNPGGGNYRLSDSSLCIDTGTNFSWMTGATDLDGNDRIFRGTVDMGAYESQNKFLDDGGASPIHYVSLTGGNVWPYTSWANAATNIQDAVDTAMSGDTVLVTNGIYSVGKTVTPGYSCLNRVVVTEDITVRSVNGPETTIILGNGPKGNNAVRGVYMSVGILEGFTVSNGYTMESGNLTFDQSAGGVNMQGGSGMITNCIISGNEGSYRGGGTFGGTVNNCTITGNTANGGGGTRGGTINNSTISDNFGRFHAGGSSLGTINNCIIIGNYCTSSSSDGGGTSGSTVNNCIISENTASNGGGTSDGTVNNCTISDNSAITAGGGTKGGTINNSIVYYNIAPVTSNRDSGTYNYSCTTPDGTNGTGNISADPMLVNLSHIATNSPCVGTGSNIYTSGVDIDGEVWKDPPSMGCDEVYANAISGSLSVAIIAEKIYSYPNLPLDFSGEISGKLYQNTWDFGDGSSETNNLNISHSWSSEGDYNVILTAINATYPAGISDTVTVHIVADTHYVNVSNTTPVIPYSSWETAATNIQDAVDVAQITGNIFVTNGTYFLSSEIEINKNITLTSVNGPENTIINGSSSVRCFNLYDHNTTISGFTITNGNIETDAGGNNMHSNCIGSACRIGGVNSR